VHPYEHSGIKDLFEKKSLSQVVDQIKLKIGLK